MKILTVVFDLGKGGTQRAAQNFCEGYALLGHDSRVLALDGQGHRRAELEALGIHVWTLQPNIINEVATWSPDVVHLHTIGIDAEVVKEMKNMFVQALFVETNVFSEQSILTDYVERSFQLSKWAAFNYVARRGSVNKCVIVPNPIKTSNFFRASPDEQLSFRQTFNIAPNAFVFGRVGQNFIDKWSFHLIDLFIRFRKNVDRSTVLLLVNPPEALVDYARDQKITEHIVLIHELTDDRQLRNCYSVIDVFLHIANQGESFGLVLAESLLCETPVITLNTPWCDNSQAEVVSHTIGGLCANTLSEFYDHMKLLHDDELLRRNMGRAGSHSIRDRYDYRAVAERSLALLSSNRNNLLTVETIVDDLKLKSSDYNIIVRRLLKIKITLFRDKLHSSFAHRVINLLIRASCGYRMRRS
mgnify:CR=1 FL=1